MRSRWSEPFTVTEVFRYGVVEISHPPKGIFKVNGHRLKLYLGGKVDLDDGINTNKLSMKDQATPGWKTSGQLIFKVNSRSQTK
ncbi:unnamed protein product [Linum trigynum]|uniref:Galectin n=1 Tax=Linum trigynum TaxID=586398 RepID=A0AAV2EW07_9ROSI